MAGVPTLRDLRARLLQHASGTANAGTGAVDDAVGTELLRAAFARLQPTSVAQFLAEDDGFLLTLDHAFLKGSFAATPRTGGGAATKDENASEQPVKRCRAEALAVLAACAPYVKCPVTNAPPGVPKIPAYETYCLPTTHPLFKAPPAAATNATEAYGALRAQAVGAPVPLAPPVAPTLLKAVRDTTVAMTTFLSGATYVNPARNGVALAVTDEMLPDADASTDLHRCVFLVAAKHAHMRRMIAGDAPQLLNEIDAEAAALRRQCRAVDERAVQQVSEQSSSARLHAMAVAGEMEGWIGDAHDKPKVPQTLSEPIVIAVAHGTPLVEGAALLPSRLGTAQSRRPTPSVVRERKLKRTRDLLPCALAGSPVVFGSHADEDSRFDSVLRTNATAAESGIESVQQEVDFAGTSSTCRDIDRLFLLCRSVLDGALPHTVLEPLCNQRLPTAEGRATTGDDGVPHPEPRPLLPVSSGLDDIMVGADDDDGAEVKPVAKVVLERIAASGSESSS